MSRQDVRIIEPVRSVGLPRFRELWAYRDLAYFLVKRDVSVRYKQSFIGALWAVAQPIGLAVVFSVFLGLLADVPSRSGIAYPLYAFSGLVCWVFFTSALQLSASSTVMSVDLITKVYFPRALLPLTATGPAVLDVGVAFCVLLIAMPLWGETPGSELLAAPVVLVGVWVLATGFGLLLSAAYVRYRDVQLVIPFAILTGLFVSPVMYPIEIMSDKAQVVYALNPMVGLLEAFRWALYGDWTADAAVLPISLGVAVAVVFAGLVYFRRSERDFADVI